MKPISEPSTHDYIVSICDQCINLEGSECHTPGCRFFLKSTDEIGELLNVLLIRPIVDGERFDVDYAKSMRTKEVK